MRKNLKPIGVKLRRKLMKKVSLKRELIMAVWATLEALKEKEIGIRATYAIVRNKKSLSAEVEAVQEASRPPEGFIAYERARLELCNKLCTKDADGQAILVQGRFQFDEESQASFNTQLSELQKQFKSALEETQQLDEQVGALMQDEVDVEIYEITMDQFKDGDLTVGQMEVLVDANIIPEDD